MNDIAVALVYHAGQDDAPRVVAKGKGSVAETIKHVAEEHGIPVYPQEKIAHMLYHVGLDKAVPMSLYTIVAEVLAWAYTLDSRKLSQRKLEV